MICRAALLPVLCFASRALAYRFAIYSNLIRSKSSVGYTIFRLCFNGSDHTRRPYLVSHLVHLCCNTFVAQQLSKLHQTQCISDYLGKMCKLCPDFMNSLFKTVNFDQLLFALRTSGVNKILHVIPFKASIRVWPTMSSASLRFGPLALANMLCEYVVYSLASVCRWCVSVPLVPK